MGWLMENDRAVDREAFEGAVGRIASAYRAHGLCAGDGIAICLHNEISYLVASFAASRIGAWVVGINWHSTPADMRYILEDSGARLLVIHDNLHAALRDGVPPGVPVVTVAPGEAVRRAYGLSPADEATLTGTERWSEWLDRFEPGAPVAAPLPNVVSYTSGTTGRPKGVRRPPFDDMAMAALERQLSQIFGYGAFDPQPGARRVTAILGPLYHMSPNNHANFSLWNDADIVIYPRFDAERLLADIERHRITHLNMVPIMFTRLLKLPAATRDRYDLSSLRHVVHAAAPCPADVKRAMIDWWGPIVTEFFGSTETGSVTFATAGEWLERPGTVGRAMDGATLRILDDKRQALPPGQPGEIAVRMAGLDRFEYIGDPEKRASVDRDGLIAPGDIGFLDDDGFLFLCDRKTDMIISGGVNIYPAEIENALHAIPEVADCAVFGVPDDEFGEAICAVIQPQAGHIADAESIRAALQGTLARYKWPRIIEFRTDLPREDSGKIFKRRLRDEWWQGARRSI